MNDIVKTVLGGTFPRDTQRATLYKWESDFVTPALPLDKDVSPAELGELLSTAYSLYGFAFCPARQLKDGRGRRHACFDYYREDGCVVLPRWARRRWVALHEAAHGIVWLMHEKDATRFAAHGPEFVRVYVASLTSLTPLGGMDGVSGLGEADGTDLERSVVGAGIKIAGVKRGEGSAEDEAMPVRLPSRRERLQSDIEKIERKIELLELSKRLAQMALRDYDKYDKYDKRNERK